MVQRVNAHIQTGHFHDADEVLEKALDALEERVTAPSRGQAAKSDDRRTGADPIAALQASPYRDLDIEPAARRSINSVGACRQVTRVSRLIRKIQEALTDFCRETHCGWARNRLLARGSETLRRFQGTCYRAATARERSFEDGLEFRDIGKSKKSKLWLQPV